MHHMLRLIAPLALGLGLPTPASALEFNQVQLDKSQVGFVSKQMGVPVDGKFKKFHAQVAFDPTKPESGRAMIEINMSSVDTGSDEADEEVVSKNWFNVKNFPTATFVSGAIKQLGGDRFEVAGKLTIKGKTKDITAPVTFKQEGNSGQFNGAFTLKRLDYGIGEGPWSDTGTVADEVRVNFKILVAAAAK